MRWLERWRLRRKAHTAFSQFVASEVIDELVNGPKRDRPTPQPAEICFILLQVCDDRLQLVPRHMARAINIIQRRNGMVWNVTSSIALATFGPPFSEDLDKARDQRAKSVARLVTELGSDIRLIYGAVDGLLGRYGAERRAVYGPILPGFARHLAALMALDFGQSAEAPST